MVSKEDINKLAELSRIEIGGSEAEKLSHEIEDILGYVGQVDQFSGSSVSAEVGEVRNVLREDIESTDSGTYTEAIMAEFPHKEKGYLKVKKILG